jgi:hypothetical protein
VGAPILHAVGSSHPLSTKLIDPLTEEQFPIKELRILDAQLSCESVPRLSGGAAVAYAGEVVSCNAFDELAINDRFL